ncbi:aldehyde dehydrogenase family protein [Streptomyces dysideae]|uniref:Aldehyde dehydrogenase n=1 Tax=Streptomyces dysideae TaxID=909626 RepID=A0A117RYL1_9ACTN|nr:aldehyde dehydrogenase family protein [Streptomyces dysideae]KUO16412.1 aldehyde dehydrogenase [Streptomyces dysideae]
MTSSVRVDRTSRVALPYPSGLPVGAGWVDTPATGDVVFPYDGSFVAAAPLGDVELVEQALESAAAAKDEVAALPTHVRRAALLRAHDALAASRTEVEQLLVLESGKPLVDCRVEVDRTLVTLSAAADETTHIHGETVPMDLLPSGEGLLGFWVRKPIGVVAAIAGFNYPLMLAAHKVAPALAAGCPVIVKPAPQTPLATLWLVHVLREALVELGAPAEAVQLVTGGVDVGRRLTTDARIGLVSFTGSAAVGHQIARDAAPTKVLLELGSNAALVVAEDADLPAAASAIVKGGYYASGQACISVQRVIAVESIRDELLALVKDRLADVTVGDPRDPATRVSALIDPASTERVNSWVEEAVRHGASSFTAGTAPDRVIPPTVLLDVPTDSRAWNEEIFGPVVGIRGVADVEAAFDLVNDSRYGLHVSVFTASLETAFTAVNRIEAGGVVVNEVPGFRSDVMPYGGVKDSGTGREGPRFAIEDMTVPRMAIIRPHTGMDS